MKGIVLAGGSGTRLYPLSLVTSKQLLPVFDKPMIYYPLSVLLQAGIRDILIISTPQDLPNFKALFGDGKNYGIKLSYLAQPKPNGLAYAFVLAEQFIGNDPVVMVLGDNLFYGVGFSKFLKIASRNLDNGYSTIFGCSTDHPERFGVIRFDDKNQIIDIIEKPREFYSDIAVCGLYFYTNDVVQIAKRLKPSLRNEYEITDISREYLKRKKLKLFQLDRAFTWLDMGTTNSLFYASKIVHSAEFVNGSKIGCIEEIVYNNGWIDKNKLLEHAEFLKDTDYGRYLISISKKKRVKSRTKE